MLYYYSVLHTFYMKLLLIYIFFVAAIVNSKQFVWWPWSGAGGAPGEQRVRTRTVASQPFWRILWKLGVTRCTGFITKAAWELARPWTRERDRDWKRRRWLTGIGGGGWQVKKKKKKNDTGNWRGTRQAAVRERRSDSFTDDLWMIYPQTCLRPSDHQKPFKSGDAASGGPSAALAHQSRLEKPTPRTEGRGRPTSSEALLSSSKRMSPFEGQTFKVEVLPFSFWFGRKNYQILWGT